MNTETILVPAEWESFANVPARPITYTSYRDGVQLPTGEYYSKEFLLSQVCEEKFNETNSELAITVPAFYQGLGDWLRCTYSILQLAKEYPVGTMQLICVDVPHARDFVHTQLSGILGSVVWIPCSYPYVQTDSCSTLDWQYDHSHVMWQYLLDQRKSKRSAKSFRNPNHRLPPYKGYYPDFRLGLFSTMQQTIDYSLTRQSLEYAHAWWNGKDRSVPCFGLAFRNDSALLSSSKRNSSVVTINYLLKELRDSIGDYNLVLFADKPPEDFHPPDGTAIYSLSEAWKYDVSISEQTAILSMADGVIGYNSGSIDLAAACGTPLLRLRSNEDNPFYNENIASPAQVNLSKRDSDQANQRAIQLACHIFANEYGNSKDLRYSYYIEGSSATAKHTGAIPPIDISRVATSNYFARPEMSQVNSPYDLLECYRTGVIPIISSGNVELLSLAGGSFGHEFLGDVLCGVINDTPIPPKTAYRKISAGYRKYVILMGKNLETRFSYFNS